MYVDLDNRFILPDDIKDTLYNRPVKFGYGVFSEIVFYRTYARTKQDGTKESWADVITRCVEGNLTIRKDWCVRNKIAWNEDNWKTYSRQLALTMFDMHWLPPGRGLSFMGTDFMYERGSMCLNNCGFIEMHEYLADDANWIMDCLMCGVGIGFAPYRDNIHTHKPTSSVKWTIPDSREGWCDSVSALINAFTVKGSPYPEFDYSQVRRKGLPINGFGGLSSGPDPLKWLHEQIEIFIKRYMDRKDPYDIVMLKTDIANCIGSTVIAGNVRRSAEIACGEISDDVFLDLKNYDKHPYRMGFGGMSNNSVYLRSDEDFLLLGKIADRVKLNGEPGIINMMNIGKARVGRSLGNLSYDNAKGFNPCGEMNLHSLELCTLVDTYPTMCRNEAEWYRACEYATTYASNVTLLPTHRSDTNAVMAKNRRIGVSLADYSGWKLTNGQHKVTAFMRHGYDVVRKTNTQLNEEAGIRDAIRVTTVKPGGTGPKLPGVTSGVGHPTFIETLRRIRVADDSPITRLLIEAGVPYERDVASMNTLVFEYPIKQGPAKPAYEVSALEQVVNIITVQREWADNAVSNTVYFKPKWVLKKHIYDYTKDVTVDSLLNQIPLKQICLLKESIYDHVEDNTRFTYTKSSYTGFFEYKFYEYDPTHEEDELANILATAAPHIKSLSLLPHSPIGVYPQMPEEGITAEEYDRRIAAIKPIDWSKLVSTEFVPELYCTSERCETYA